MKATCAVVGGLLFVAAWAVSLSAADANKTDVPKVTAAMKKMIANCQELAKRMKQGSANATVIGAARSPGPTTARSSTQGGANSTTIGAAGATPSPADIALCRTLGIIIASQKPAVTPGPVAQSQPASGGGQIGTADGCARVQLAGTAGGVTAAGKPLSQEVRQLQSRVQTLRATLAQVEKGLRLVLERIQGAERCGQ